jgi:hypothetical protein
LSGLLGLAQLVAVVWALVLAFQVRGELNKAARQGRELFAGAEDGVDATKAG